MRIKVFWYIWISLALTTLVAAFAAFFLMRAVNPPIETGVLIRRTVLTAIIGFSAGSVTALLASSVYKRKQRKAERFNHTETYNRDIENKALNIPEKTFAGLRSDAGLQSSDIRRQNEEFRAVLSSMADGILALDKDQRVIYINPMAAEIFGIKTMYEINGQLLTDIIYQQKIIDGVAKCLSSGETRVFQLKIGREETYDYRVTISPMLRLSGYSGVVILLTDITHMLELERLRTDFVANVSHELRTPLTSIKGYTEALKDSALGEEGYAKRFLEIIEIESDRLNVLINDLMELSKIENRSEDTNIGEHNIANIFNETIELVAMKAKEKGIIIRSQIPEKICVLANKDRIKQLALNLIDNGIKYNKEGGKLDISIYHTGKMLTISVKDTGEGIAEADIPRLFERFYRVEKSRSRELGGTGLGLSIVKHITELYQGSVTVISEKGKGSEFIVKMPIAKVDEENE